MYMKTYDEITKKEIQNPDLTKGYLYEGTIITGKTEPKTVIMNGSVTSDRLEGLREHKEPEDIVESCMYYHKYTEEDLKQEIDSKIAKLESSRDEIIYAGADITLSDGTKKHFTYTPADQTDVSDMFNAVMLGMSAYIYHNGEYDCEIYSKEDILIIYSTLSSLKTKEKTYCSQLCGYVKTLKTVPEVKAVTYGQTLIDTYLEKYNTLLAFAMTEMQNTLERLGKQ